MTLLDYFESKFQDNKHLIRWTGIVIILIFITAYVAAQLNAGAKSLSVALDTPFLLSLAISAALIVIYMVLGGFLAVAYNDVIRAIIMIIGLVLFPILTFIKLISLDHLYIILKSLDPHSVDPMALSLGAFAGFIGIGLGSPGQPHIVVRYMSIKESDHLRWSALIGTIWNVLLAWGALFIGLIGKAVVPLSKLPDGNTEMIYLKLASDFFGPVFYGLLIGGIFAAILSTADSQLMVLSSTIVRDLYEKIIGPKKEIPEKEKIRLARIVIVLAGLFATLLAYLAKDLIFWLVLFAWGGLGASFGSTLILSLYWKKTTRIGIIAGMISGTVITIIWKLFLKTSTGLYELIPAFFGALGMTVLASLLSQVNLQKSGNK